MCDCNILGIQDFPFDCHAVSYHDMCSIYLIQHAQRRIMFSEVRSSNVSGPPSNIDATSRQISEQFTSDYIVPVLASRLIKKESKMSKSVIRSPFCSRN